MNFKKLASGAETLFSRAKQYTGEALGQVEKTEYEKEVLDYFSSCDKIKLWTEKLIKETEGLLQPNPATRLEDFLTEKLQSYKPDHQTELDLFSKTLCAAADDLGSSSAYGVTLKNCGEAEKKVAEEWRKFCAAIVQEFVVPMKAFLDIEIAEAMRERKNLETKRLDLDAAKGRHKRVTCGDKEPSPNDLLKADEMLKQAQEEYEGQLQVVKKLMQDVCNYQANHIRFLRSFSEAQASYYLASAEVLKAFASE